MSASFTPTSRADITRLLSQAEAAGAGHLAGILGPVIRGELDLIAPTRNTLALPFKRVSRRGRPVVVILGDDDYCHAGPGTWACAGRIRAWASFAIVHGTGAQRAHYDMAAGVAQRVGRLLLIETTAAAAQDWAGFLHGRTRALRFMGLLPPDGVHPVMLAKRGVH